MKRTGRNLNFNGKEPVGFDKTKVECYNFHRKGHFARECRAPRNQGNRSANNERVFPVETSTSALVVQDGLGGYDWSNQAKEGPTYFALMAHSSDSANLSNFEDQGIFDSGCSRQMTGNKFFLIEYQEINGGIVAFGGSPKRGKITGKVNGKADERFLVRYFVNSKAFRVFNSRTRKVEEALHVNFLENKPNVTRSRPQWLFDIHSLKKSMNYEPVFAGNQSNGDSLDVNVGDQPGDVNAGDIQGDVDEISRNDYVCQGNEIRIDYSTYVVNTASTSFNTANNIIAADSVNINIADSNHINMPTLEATDIFDGAFDDKDLGEEADTNNLDSSIVVSLIPITRVQKDHPNKQIIRDPNLNIQTRRMINFSEETAMDVWTLVDLPHGKRAIGSKWVFRNKLDERGIVIRNKARLIAQGQAQEERIDYDEVFAPVAWIEAIRLFSAYASFKDFIVYQMDVKSVFLYGKIEEEMDVKSVFLYGKIEEEVYICQPPRFKDPNFPDKVYKVKKALYGLHQAPRACQDKYVAKILKKFGFSEVKTACTRMETSKPLLKDKDGQEIVVANSTTKAEYVAASSCCGQATVKVKKVNDKEKIQALVDKTKVIITKDSLRSDLLFDDAEGTACLLSEAIFKGLARMGAKTTAWNEFSSTMASAIIYLAENQKFNFSKRKQRKDAKVSHDESKDKDHVPTPFSDPLPSGEDSLILTELMVFCTSLQEQALELQEAKAAQGKEIADLKKKGRTNDDEMFGVDDLDGEEVIIETTTGVKDSAALTTDVIKDEVIMAQALAALKSTKPKVVDKGKAKMIKPEVPIKRKEQMKIDEEEEFLKVEKARLLVELIEKRKKHLAALRAQEKRKAQESSTKRKEKHLKSDFSKKQKVDENIKPVVDDSKKLIKCIEIVLDDGDEVLIEATPISSRSLTVIDYKIHREGKKTYFKIIKADVMTKMMELQHNQKLKIQNQPKKLRYPKRLRKEKMEAQYKKFLDMIRVVRINVPLIDVLARMPNYGKFLKELIRNKHKIEQIFAAFLSDESSAMIQNKVSPKLRDPGSFLIPCNFNKTFSCNALVNLGASINLMPYSLYAKLSLKTLKPIKMSIRLADRSFQYPIGIAKNMLVKVGKFSFPANFVILEMEEDSKVPLILGRPFLYIVEQLFELNRNNSIMELELNE
nr:reverse transcriptase domain-containing protein [Tanacetum cinerariifolium]